MLVHDVEQGTDEWHNIRLGIPTASEFSKIITPTGKKSSQADAYMNKLIAERLMGHSYDSFEKNEWIERGNELEEDAASFYSLVTDKEVNKIGFVTNNNKTYGCSPDRIVEGYGLLEIKCPAPHTHAGYLRTGKIDMKYYPQVQGQMMICESDCCDWLSYHPEMQPSIITVERDDKFTDLLGEMLDEFCEKLENEYERIKNA